MKLQNDPNCTCPAYRKYADDICDHCLDLIIARMDERAEQEELDRQRSSEEEPVT